MLSIKFIRENPEIVQSGVTAKGENPNLEKILQIDKEHRSLLTQLNEYRTERNRASEAIGLAKREGRDTSSAIDAMQSVAATIREMEELTSAKEQELRTLLLGMPNLPHTTVPVGEDAGNNVIVREWGGKPTFDFQPADHLFLGEKLELFDFTRGAKISGSGFPLYTGQGAKLERALINFMLDHHISDYGYTEIFPPFAARYEAMQTTGQLPKFAEDMYFVNDDGLYLVPTAEVPVTNIHRDEILAENALPKYYAAYSACFRREAGSYGKDTRGFLRLHQFNKVELVKFVKPEDSYNELESLTLQAESVLQALGLTYRTMALCTGDLSFSAAKCYDLEVWAPGERKWLEVSSCSNFEDFQARRGNIRYRREDDNKVEFVHTLNGSGLATPRLLVALLETYQTDDGKINLPKPLHSYFGSEIIA